VGLRRDQCRGLETFEAIAWAREWYIIPAFFILFFPYSEWPSDVTDLAWSPEDRHLASVGLDSQVLIWSGYTLGGSHYISSRSV
jgi:hypothetical protein